jgi:hypothetical protein
VVRLRCRLGELGSRWEIWKAAESFQSVVSSAAEDGRDPAREALDRFLGQNNVAPRGWKSGQQGKRARNRRDKDEGPGNDSFALVQVGGDGNV